jgi:hypothetical protein
MRVQGNVQGKIEVGFKRADDGWHIAKFQEGIDLLKNKAQEVLKTKAGDRKWKFPLVVDDPEDDSHEIGVDIITQENPRGEQLVADLLGATGLFKKFQENFPGDVSIFEDKVIDKVKVKLSSPAQYIRIKTHQSPNTKDPDNPYVNVIGFGPMSTTVEALEAALFPKKEGAKDEAKAGKKEKKEEKAKVEDDWTM